MRLAIIPARGGSKRIPGKNIREFCGKPMIVWTIEAAQESGCFDTIVVSTDDPAIAEIAASHGASVPFVRPDELCEDVTPTAPVIRHAIEALQAHRELDAHVCCLYPASPFLLGPDVRAAQDELVRGAWDYVFPVTSFPSPIQRALRRGERGELSMLDARMFTTRSQDLEPMFHDAGQFYWGRVEAWMKDLPIFGPRSFGLVLPRWRVVDIDTPEDLDCAEAFFSLLKNSARS